jgi:hypothetical protein
MYRITIVAVACSVLVTAPLDAQRSLGAAAVPGISFHPPVPAPVPTRAVPDRLPDAARHVRPAVPGTDLFLAGPKTYAPRFDRRRRAHLYPVFFPYQVLPYFGLGEYPMPYAHDASGVPAGAEPIPSGYLRLDVQPTTAQVYVDGFFVGSAEDVTTPVPLEPGTYQVEVKADGFETAVFDIRVRANATLRLSSRLVRVKEDPTIRLKPDSGAGSLRSDVPIASISRTLYVIPRCYAGDRMPLPSQLPAGCRLADVRVIAPDSR